VVIMNKYKSYGKGWHFESIRHGFAAKGIKTTFGRKLTNEEILERIGFKESKEGAKQDKNIERFIKVKGRRKEKIMSLSVNEEEKENPRYEFIIQPTDVLKKREEREERGYKEEIKKKYSVEEGDDFYVKIMFVDWEGNGIAKRNGYVICVPNVGVKVGDMVRVRVTRVERSAGFAKIIV